MSVLYYWCYPVPEVVLVCIPSIRSLLKNSTQLRGLLAASNSSTHAKYCSTWYKYLKTFKVYILVFHTWHMRDIQYESMRNILTNPAARSIKYIVL